MVASSSPIQNMLFEALSALKTLCILSTLVSVYIRVYIVRSDGFIRVKSTDLLHVGIILGATLQLLVPITQLVSVEILRIETQPLFLYRKCVCVI